MSDPKPEAPARRRLRFLPRRRRRRDGSMSVVEHLEELRKRLLISLGAIAVTSVVGFVFNRQILDVLVEPYTVALRSLPKGAAPPGAFSEGLVFSSPADAFLTVLKVGFFTGFVLALPVVLWQLWRFITPALSKRERRIGVAFVIASLVLFLGGAAFAFSILPRGLDFLLGFGGDTLVPLLHADRYIGFLIFLILAFGLSFEFPLLMIFLAGARIVTTAQMRRWRRMVYFGLAVFAAFATPTQDPYTMLLMLVPMAAFYEAAILVARAFKR